MAGMKLPRFTLRDMFVTTTLIAVGVGAATFTFRYGDPDKDAVWVVPVLLTAAAAIGAGIFAPFHRKELGAKIGMFAAIATFVVGRIIYVLSQWHS
jgi:hypothetical protein